MSKRCRQNRKMCRIPVILVYLLGFAPLARFKRPPKEIGCRHLDHIKRVKDFARITQFSGFRLSLAKQRAAIFGALRSSHDISDRKNNNSSVELADRYDIFGLFWRRGEMERETGGQIDFYSETDAMRRRLSRAAVQSGWGDATGPRNKQCQVVSPIGGVTILGLRKNSATCPALCSR